MAYLLYFFVLLSLTAMVLGILTLLHPRHSEDAMVVFPKIILVIGLFGDALSLLFVGIIQWTQSSLGPSLLFSLLALLNSLLILACRNIRITYNEEGFVSYNFWGRCHRYSYGDITGIFGKNRDITLWVGKHTVRIDAYSVGRSAFLAQAKKRYRICHNGAAIPAKRPKGDVFNGNVEEPGALLAVCGFLILLGCSTVIFLLVDCYYDIHRPLESAVVAFSRYEIEQSEILLYTNSSGLPYSLSGYRKTMADPERFLAQCDSGEQFQVQYVAYGKEDSAFYSLQSISGEDGTDYLTLAEMHRRIGRTTLALCALFGGLTLVMAYFLVMAIRIGRHPERYTRRFVHRFFKPGYIRTEKCKK